MSALLLESELSHSKERQRAFDAVKQIWGHTQVTTGELRHKPKLI